MENLVLLGEKRRRLELPSSNPHFDLANESTIVDLCQVSLDDMDFGPTCNVILTEIGIVTKMDDSGSVLWTCNLREESEIDCGWFKIDFVDPDVVCLSKRGAIVTVDPSTGEAELVGIFDKGLEDAVWSPDGQILLMVTSTEEDTEENLPENDPRINSRLMTMNTHFEILAEVTIPAYVPSATSVDADISLAWRPDGTLCAVSSVDVEDGVRKIRIYNRETLDMHAIGRAEDASGNLVKNLQKARIAWAGTGCSQLLAGVQRKGKKSHQIVFFEPNGLRHREFLLRESPSTNVSSLAWNSISDILAVALREEEGLEKIQLWHRMNYHWYLKREFRYPGCQIERVTFNKGNHYQLWVLLRGHEWREYEVWWDSSTVCAWQGNCNAFVVDGSSLNITEFEKALIPPPMYGTSHSVEFAVNELSFCYSEQYRGSALISMSTGILAFLAFESDSSAYRNPVNILWEDLQSYNPISFRSFLVIKTDARRLHFVCVACAPCNEANESLIEGAVEGFDSGELKAFIRKSYPLVGRVLRITRWLDASGGCLLQLRDRSLFEYETSDIGGSLLPSQAEPLPEECPWISAIKDGSLYAKGSHADVERSRLMFGQSSKSRLYYHDIMLSDSVSSFTVSLTHEFLCYVSKGSRCQARFLPLSEVHCFDPLMGLDQTHILEGYEPRSVEHGSRVVAVLPKTPQMVLQMPRGNLEGIHPRALLLRFVIKKVTDGSFGEAFRMMRKHKVDLNIVVDLDPMGFLEDGMLSFVKEVDNIDHLNLFISNLQNYDTTKTKFPVPSWFRKDDPRTTDGSLFDFSNKVNQVCARARGIMMTIEKVNEKPNRYYLLPILSTFAKEEPPKLAEALRLIKEDALRQPLKSSAKNPLFSESAQHSIHYLAFLAEYELLFETALGMYDYEIARAVARNSQMDPKLYLPLLKRYNALPKYFSRFEVDVRLKRYDLALRNLHKSHLANESFDDSVEATTGGVTGGNTFNDCLLFIQEHLLYKVGLELFNRDVEEKRTILIALGDSLMKQNQPKTALIVYLSTDPPYSEGAKHAARASKDWRMYFSLLEDSSSKDDNGVLLEKRRQSAREIAADIATSAGFSSESVREACLDAARILVDYGDDLIGAIDYLVQAECWSEGYRVAVLKDRDDLKKRVVDGAVAFAHKSIENFADRVSEFETTNNRYAQALSLRKQNVLLEGPHPSTDMDDTGSLFSTASTASNMSLKSGTSKFSSGSGVSSVISIKSTTTFQMTGSEDNDRHRSKFNKGKKRRQKQNKKKPKQRAGSEAELRELVGVMKASCPNPVYAAVISETIRFLIFADQSSLAEELYADYLRMCEAVEKSRLERITANANQKHAAALLTRTQGDQHDQSHLLLDLLVEKEVDEMACALLDTEISNHFDFLLAENYTT
jgi:elongator complex protein 1